MEKKKKEKKRKRRRRKEITIEPMEASKSHKSKYMNKFYHEKRNLDRKKEI